MVPATVARGDGYHLPPMSFPEPVRPSWSAGLGRRLAPRALVLLALGLALVAFTAHLDREARFLAVGGGLGLLGIAIADEVRARATALAAAALFLVVVAMPEGLGRATAVTTVLLLFGTAVLTSRWRSEGELDFAAALGLGFLVQAVCRPEWILGASEHPAVLLRLLFGPPLVAAAYAWVRRFWDPRAAATALLVVLALGRGATPIAAFAIVAPWLWEIGNASGLRRLALGAGLVAASFWRFGAAVTGAVAAGLRRVPPVALLGCGAVAAVVAAVWGSHEAPGDLYLLLVVLPAFGWPVLRRPLEGAGLLLLAAAAAALAGPAGAAIVGTVAVARLDAAGRWPRGALGWAAVTGVGLAASYAYPWLREGPAWWRGSPAWTALAAMVVFAIGHLASSRRAWGWAAAGLAGWAVLVAGIRSPGTDLRQGKGAVVLTTDARFWGADWEPSTVCRLAVESAVANGSGLPSGEEVGWVGLLLHDGPERRFPLRVGVSTGEWAARRDPASEAPAPWIHWVADGDFFGQRYRAAWDVAPEASGVRRVRVVRRPDLPPEVELMVWTLQAGPC